MIKTFRHKGLKAFFEKGSMAGIQTVHAPRLGAMLRRLNETTNVQGMNLPGWGLHPLKGRELIPFPDHPCRLLHLLAVLKHCLRRRAYFTNDLEMESRGIFLFGSAAIGE